jgi:hypothetical protein
VLPNDIDPALFGEKLLDVLRRHDFGVLGKPQLESAIFYALKEASSKFRSADAFTRAELLQIPDSSYRSLNRRASMWLSTPDSRASHEEILAECLEKLIQDYALNPSSKTMRLLFDDDVKLRNCQAVLERIDRSGRGIKPDLSISGRHLLLRSHDLDRLIQLIGQVGGGEAEFAPLLQAKNAAAMKKSIADLWSSAPELISQLCVRVAGAMLTSNG